jgi:hypothetical protein
MTVTTANLLLVRPSPPNVDSCIDANLRRGDSMPTIIYPLVMVIGADGRFHGDGHAIAFTSAEHAATYLDAHLARGSLSVRFAHSKDVLLLLADLHEAGMAGVLLNPESDGSGGHAVRLADLVGPGQT